MSALPTQTQLTVHTGLIRLAYKTRAINISSPKSQQRLQVTGQSFVRWLRHSKLSQIFSTISGLD